MSAHTAQTELKLVGKLILEGEMLCETGLHVGAGKGSLEIGGADNPVVKDAQGRPYVPGSSLRGRIRSLLEQATGMAVPSELVYISKRKGQEVRIHQSDRPDDEICILFGRSPGRMEKGGSGPGQKVGSEDDAGGHATPARLSVFDAPLISASITPQMRENLDDELTEVKSENAIDRITSQANPRTLERVPAGARFRVRMVLDLLCAEDAVLPALLVQGLRLLEDDALGGGGSRGNGRVSFDNLKLTWRGRDFYAAGADEREVVSGADLAGLRAKVAEVGDSWSLPDMALIEVRLRPTTPWRVGHGGGDRERVDLVYHSDALYSAITQGMKTLGWLDEWLAATAQTEGEPAVRFSSLFPFMGKMRLIAPPKTWWPPANPGRLHTGAATLIPLEIVRHGIVDESRWMVDGETGCLFHTGSDAPVRIVVRTAAAIDRLTGVADPHRIACLEFAHNAGWWGVFAVEDSLWEDRVKSAFRLLADSGFGGERSRGWGRSATPEFSDASALLPSKAADEGAWWLISVYSPHPGDTVDWSRGDYAAALRGGWTDSQSGVAPKKQVRVIEEGSVLFAPSLRGRAVDVAPDGFPHSVYRAGFALAVPAPTEPVPVIRQTQPVAAPEPEAGPTPSEPPAGTDSEAVEPSVSPIESEPEPVAGPVPAEPEAAPALPDTPPETPPEAAPEAEAITEAIAAEPEVIAPAAPEPESLPATPSAPAEPEPVAQPEPAPEEPS